MSEHISIYLGKYFQGMTEVQFLVSYVHVAKPKLMLNNPMNIQSLPILGF